MQLMTLLSGGKMDQHLPDTLPSHERHKRNTHPISHAIPTRHGGFPPVRCGAITGRRWWVRGSMRVVAKSDDGVIEAVEDPARRLCRGAVAPRAE